MSITSTSRVRTQPSQRTGTRTSTGTSPLQFFRALGVLVALLGLCGAGLWLGLRASWPMDLSSDPTVAVMAVIRLFAVGLSLWIGIPTVAAVIARLLQLRHLSERAMRLLPGVARDILTRWVLRPTATVALISGLTIPPANASDGPSVVTVAQVSVSGDVTNGQRWPSIAQPALVDPDAPMLRRRGSAQGTTTRSRSSQTPAPGVLSVPVSGMASVPVTSPGAASPASTAPTTRPGNVGRQPTSPARGTQGGLADPSTATSAESRSTWTVKPGDHFWSIAAQVVHRVHPGASEHHVHLYWSGLVEANRAVLSDPSNPDLLHIGAVLTLPTVPASFTGR